MRTSIIALATSFVALALAAFATFTALQGDGTTTTPGTESSWSRGDCTRAAEELADLRWRCILESDCAPDTVITDKVAAFNANCE